MTTEVEMIRYPSPALSAFIATWMVAMPAAGQDDFSRSIAGIEDGRGGLAMSLELSIKVYRPLATPQPHGDLLVAQEFQPGSTEETILRYIQMAVRGDTEGMAKLHEPGQGDVREAGSCPCGPNRGPYYRIPDSFKLVSFRYAWLYRDYAVYMVTFRESARRSSGVFISTRRRDGRIFIAARPGGPVYEATSFLISLADPDRSPISAIGNPPEDLSHTVRIDGGTNPIDIHFTGTLQPAFVHWLPAGQSEHTGRVAAYASQILATSAELSDEAFIDLFHPWVSGSLRSRVASDPGYLAEVRDIYASDADIAHVFTVDVGHRQLHTYLTEDRQDQLRHMLLMRDGEEVAPAGTPPEHGLQSLLQIDAIQQYLLRIWREQN